MTSTTSNTPPADPPPRGSSKLTAKDLREAIRRGTQLAEEEALWKLAMKAKQVAEHDRRRALRPGQRLVYDRDMKSENFTVRDTGHIDDGAYRVVRLADGSEMVEEWRGGTWVPGGATFGEIADAPPVGPAFAAKLGVPLADLGGRTSDPPRSGRSPNI